MYVAVTRQDWVPYRVDGKPLLAKTMNKAAEVVVPPEVVWKAESELPIHNDWQTREGRKVFQYPLPVGFPHGSKKHFCHAATTKPGYIAFTESPLKGWLDIQTVMKPGRYLKKYRKDLSEVDVMEWAEKFVVSNFSLEITRDHKRIHTAYMAIRSCMSEDSWVQPHPSACYGGDSDFEMAIVLDSEGSIVARTLICVPLKQYVHLYGRVYTAQHMLTEAGYARMETYNGYSPSIAKGMKLNAVPARNKNVFVRTSHDWGDTNYRYESGKLVIDPYGWLRNNDYRGGVTRLVGYVGDCVKCGHHRVIAMECCTVCQERDIRNLESFEDFRKRYWESRDSVGDK